MHLITTTHQSTTYLQTLHELTNITLKRKMRTIKWKRQNNQVKGCQRGKGLQPQRSIVMCHMTKGIKQLIKRDLLKDEGKL